MSSEGSAEVKVKWKVLGVEMELVLLQPHRSLNVDKEQPEEYCWEADPLLRVPDVLHPDVGAGSEEEPVDRYEEETDHVAGQGYADEEN